MHAHSLGTPQYQDVNPYEVKAVEFKYISMFISGVLHADWYHK